MSTAALPQVKPGTRVSLASAHAASRSRAAPSSAGSWSTRRQCCRRGSEAASARRFEPVPQPRSMIATVSRPAKTERSSATRAGLRARWSAGSRRASHSALKPLMPPPASAPPATAAAVSLQRGSAWPAAQDASAKRRRSCASAIMSASAAASAAASPGGTLMAAASGTVSAAAPPVEATIGSPRAIASASTMP